MVWKIEISTLFMVDAPPGLIKAEQDKHDNSEDHRSYYVEEKVDTRGPFCIFSCSRAGKKGGYAGSYILPSVINTADCQFTTPLRASV